MDKSHKLEIRVHISYGHGHIMYDWAAKISELLTITNMAGLVRTAILKNPQKQLPGQNLGIRVPDDIEKIEFVVVDSQGSDRLCKFIGDNREFMRAANKLDTPFGEKVLDVLKESKPNEEASGATKANFWITLTDAKAWELLSNGSGMTATLDGQEV